MLRIACNPCNIVLKYSYYLAYLVPRRKVISRYLRGEKCLIYFSQINILLFLTSQDKDNHQEPTLKDQDFLGGTAINQKSYSMLKQSCSKRVCIPSVTVISLCTYRVQFCRQYRVLSLHRSTVTLLLTAMMCLCLKIKTQHHPVDYNICTCTVIVNHLLMSLEYAFKLSCM